MTVRCLWVFGDPTWSVCPSMIVSRMAFSTGPDTRLTLLIVHNIGFAFRHAFADANRAVCERCV